MAAHDVSFVSRMATAAQEGKGTSIFDYLEDTPENPLKRGVLLMKRLNMKKESVWICREFWLGEDVLYYSMVGHTKALDSIKLADIDHLQLQLPSGDDASGTSKRGTPKHGRRNSTIGRFGRKSVRRPE
jgi:hypothetical protein